MTAISAAILPQHWRRPYRLDHRAGCGNGWLRRAEWRATSVGWSSRPQNRPSPNASQRHVLYLIGEGRVAEGFAAVEHLAQQENDPVEQANAYSLWAGLTRSHKGDPALTIARARLSMKLRSKLMASHREMMWAFVLMGHDQEALREAEAMQRFQEKDQPAVLKGSGFAENGHGRRLHAQHRPRRSRRPCRTAIAGFAPRPRSPSPRRNLSAAPMTRTAARAPACRGHSVRAGIQQDRRIGLDTDIAKARYFERANIGDWPAATASAASCRAVRNDPVISPQLKALKLRLQVAPLLAYPGKRRRSCRRRSRDRRNAGRLL